MVGLVGKGTPEARHILPILPHQRQEAALRHVVGEQQQDILPLHHLRHAGIGIQRVVLQDGAACLVEEPEPQIAVFQGQEQQYAVPGALHHANVFDFLVGEGQHRLHGAHIQLVAVGGGGNAVKAVAAANLGKVRSRREIGGGEHQIDPAVGDAAVFIEAIARTHRLHEHLKKISVLCASNRHGNPGSIGNGNVEIAL